MIQKYKYTILLQFCRPTWYCVCAIEEYLSNTKKVKKNYCLFVRVCLLWRFN